MKNKNSFDNKTSGGYLRNIEKVWKLKEQAYQETKNLSSENYWKHIHSEVVAIQATIETTHEK